MGHLNHPYGRSSNDKGAQEERRDPRIHKSQMLENSREINMTVSEQGFRLNPSTL